MTSVGHDGIFIAIIGLLAAIVASPVLIAIAQNYLLKKHVGLADVLNELKEIKSHIAQHNKRKLIEEEEQAYDQ